MTDLKVPYVNAYGNVSKTLEKIQTAQTPDRFTQDFLATKLDLKGGSPKPVIPFLKRAGFLRTDGTPTDRYRRFRNSSSSGAAAAEALREAFAPLYEINEYAHDLKDSELKGVITQATGLEGGSPTVDRIVGTFKALRRFADFNEIPDVGRESSDSSAKNDQDSTTHPRTPVGLNLGYTINLHLPATADIAVYNAIFKSRRENLLG